MSYKNKIMETMLELVSVPGISGTSSENLTSKKIFEILSSIPYFRINPDKLQSIKINGDPLNRTFISALYIGDTSSNKTIIITGHFDVVGVEEYGHLKDIAFNPIKLTERIHELSLDSDSKCDLESGKWLFGRGTADMKYGIALCIELMRKLSSSEDFHGNILFLAVPGEESNSEGMLGALPHLVELQEKSKLEFTGILLPEPFIYRNSKDSTRYIHIGSCGKIMPLFFITGKETHVSAPFEGISPSFLACELNNIIEYSTDLCTCDRGKISPPPVCLKSMDLKELYSVQTPISFAAYYNLITFNSDPDELIEKLKEKAIWAFNNAIEKISIRRKSYECMPGAKLSKLDISANVITYKELYQKVKGICGNEVDKNITEEIKNCQNKGMDIQSTAINIIKRVYEMYPDKSPIIIIGFAPPYYPDRYPSSKNSEFDSFFNTIDYIIDYAKSKFNESIVTDDYYTGICDLSYTGIKDDIDMDSIESNLIGLGYTYSFPFEYLKKLNIPGIVFGVYGKDIHKYTERLNIPYAFDVLPYLYEEFIYKMF